MLQMIFVLHTCNPTSLELEALALELEVLALELEVLALEVLILALELEINNDPSLEWRVSN